MRAANDGGGSCNAVETQTLEVLELSIRMGSFYFCNHPPPQLFIASSQGCTP
ncbi:hypothetical protein HMPREF9069_00624 [Atopobium sp. oral taxon 810 str. F0209]|nr:hypothetical protein HMPREF9069_00624 [Atopobium sp. oral taxon 810 str. F0209]